jgi:ADP-heptose:LPS heptosyltransferase
MRAERVIVSRTDHIGDVVLTLPMVGILRQHYPLLEILFLGRSYTRAAVECCEHVDRFLAWDEVAGSAMSTQAAFLRDQGADVIIHVYPQREIAAAARMGRIANRVGTSHRAFHLWNCNRWVNFTRRKSDLHESQLNVKLLRPLGIRSVPMLTEVPELYGLTKVKPLGLELARLLSKSKLNLILHPTTSGNAKAWSLENYSRLIDSLPAERYEIFVTGTDRDREAIGDRLPFAKTNVTSLIGKMSLSDLLAFISEADALVCASTGPVHIAAALDKCAIGIYSPRGIARPGRYGPVGRSAHALVFDPNCEKCLAGADCDCLQEIPLSAIHEILDPLADDIIRSRRAREG